MIVRSDGTRTLGLLISLSDEAFCIHSLRPPIANETIQIRVPGNGGFLGVVRWTDFSQAGGTIETPTMTIERTG